ncbi:MAG: hypothetical protein M3069_30445 [Chloroflexota bacterium]|nr:hypothetical protein [Chloroflexota bacterium]
MTTTNGGRIVEHLSVVVASANDRAVKLEGDNGEGWRNFSKYGEPITPPRRGQRVSLGLDGSGFVRELQVLDAAAAPSSAAPTLRDHHHPPGLPEGSRDVLRWEGAQHRGVDSGRPEDRRGVRAVDPEKGGEQPV